MQVMVFMIPCSLSDSDVSTICTGMAASFAAVLLVAGTKGKRMALPHSRVMIHQPLGGVQGQASDIEITAREILKVKKELYTIISTHSGKPYEEVERDSDRDYWMTAEEAKAYGMVDGSWSVIVNNKHRDKAFAPCLFRQINKQNIYGQNRRRLYVLWEKQSGR